MSHTESTTKNFFYPPGGILLWIIVFLELITFGAALVSATVYASREPELFHFSRMQLSTFSGTLNTVLLLCSGFFMASAVHKLKEAERKKTTFFLQLTILLGLFFVLSKSVEYYIKIEAGISFSSNLFFSFYWSLTIFHLAHVIAGLVILLFFLIKLKENKMPAVDDFEAGATFWHLCDLIWLLIFPTLYLLF